MSYPSDISAKQFTVIRPTLESARTKTRALENDIREVFNAILDVLRESCRWRPLPHDSPKWERVYDRYAKCRDHIDEESGLAFWCQILKKLKLWIVSETGVMRKPRCTLSMHKALKVPEALEELRTQTQNFSSHDPHRVRLTPLEKNLYRH